MVYTRTRSWFYYAIQPHANIGAGNIGAGGFGYVKKAIWRGLGMKKMYVAVKSFFESRAESKGGFVEEVRRIQL